MKFQRRDILLLVASLFFVIGLSPFVPLGYSILIGVGVFFGIKGFYEKRRKSIQKAVGQGLCYHCGQKLVENSCPNCDLDTN